MKSNVNNKAAQKQRRIGALERLRDQLKSGQKPAKIDAYVKYFLLLKEDRTMFVSLSNTDRKRIEKEINLLEERTKLVCSSEHSKPEQEWYHKQIKP